MKTAPPSIRGASMLCDVVPEHWLTAACKVAGRDLTAAERRQYPPDRKRIDLCPGA